MKKKIQVDNNGQQYILFRIDIYFTKYCLAVEIDEKGHTDRDLIFEEKRQKALEKKLNCTFIRINTSRENFDADYEASEIQAFISQFKDNEIKERDNKNKELEDKIKEKDNKNKELKNEIKEIDNKNKELKDEIKEKDNKNKELEDEIKKIKATVSKFGYKK